MRDEDPYSARDRADEDAWARRGRAFMRYLRTRPPEVWGFFAAGIVLGALIG